jgi:hypothetical protein
MCRNHSKDWVIAYGDLKKNLKKVHLPALSWQYGLVGVTIFTERVSENK